MEARVAGLRGVTHVFSTIGDTTGRITRGQGDVTEGTIYARLTDLDQRQRSWHDLTYWLNALLESPRIGSGGISASSTCSAKPARRWRITPISGIAVQDSAIVSGAGLKQSMIEFNLRGPDLNKLEEFTGKADYRDPRTGEFKPGLVQWMKAQPWFLDVDTSLSLRKPELRVKIDREKASDLGIPVQKSPRP